MYALLFWEDSTFSVVALQNIIKPRKEINDYEVGDHVEAKFQGKPYKARIYEIGDNKGNLNKSLNAGFKIDLSRIEETTTKKRHSSAPEVNKAQAEKKQKRRHHSDEHGLQIEDPLVLQARQILLKRRSLKPAPSTSIQPLNTTNITTTQSETTSQPLNTTNITNTQSETTSQPLNTTNITTTQSETTIQTDIDLQNLGPSPPAAMKVSYVDMLSSPLYDDEVCYSATKYSEFDNCWQLIQQLQSRMTQLEAEMQLLRNATSSPSLISCSTTSCMPATPHRNTPLSTPQVLMSNTLDQRTTSQTLQQIIQAELRHETRLAKAITRSMTLMFTPEQLVNCSMKGAPTTSGQKRPGLPSSERAAIIDVISEKFDISRVEVEEKMRGSLRRLRSMYQQN